MYGNGENHLNWNKPDPERQLPCSLSFVHLRLYMESLRLCRNMHMLCTRDMCTCGTWKQKEAGGKKNRGRKKWEKQRMEDSRRENVVKHPALEPNCIKADHYLSRINWQQEKLERFFLYSLFFCRWYCNTLMSYLELTQVHKILSANSPAFPTGQLLW